MSVRGLIKRLPYPIKQGLKYAYGAIPPRIRYGKVFWETYNFLQESQWWSREKLEEYQMQQLSKLLHHAYENVPFYRQWFNEKKLRPEDVQSISDLRQFPLLSKSAIEKRKQDFVSAVHSPKKMEPAHTGGSTGSPMHFWYEKGVARAKERAFFERMWRWHGYNSWKDKSVVVSGSFQLGERISFDPARNTLYLVNPIITPCKVDEYITVIRGFQPKVIRGYPSLIYGLARFINRYNIKMHLPSIKVIFCNSEQVYAFQRKEIALAFNCKVVDHYGHSEMLALLQKCEVNREHHVIMEYGITEVVGPNGLPLPPGETCGELVATGFNNYAFPLIRYRTEDWVILSEDPSPCPCGRSYLRIKDVIGRSGDFILTPSGKLISPTSIAFAMRYIRNFKDVQIVQVDTDMLEIQIVPEASYTREEGERLTGGVKARIAEEMKIQVVLVDEIERPPNQKRRFVESEIASQFLEIDK